MVDHHHVRNLPWIVRLDKELTKESLGVTLGKLEPFSPIYKPLTKRLLKRKISNNEDLEKLGDDVETALWKYGKKCIREQQKKG